ncbi:hypothetical protein AK812_SmicGene1840 [Symbiodinium microadriaticum]|uniref:Uncharacterized protein n=1 Tax=Symbiodinium microadriaticum TaxID=2951 RepID=A0A1Q9F2Z1_SYMMI|nr:hypothetical protein AK812_SmicGene1840 [Symbiodinium microadriaticum]
MFKTSSMVSTKINMPHNLNCRLSFSSRKKEFPMLYFTTYTILGTIGFMPIFVVLIVVIIMTVISSIIVIISLRASSLQVPASPPHERSSTIMDMMLMLASDLPVQEWTEQYLMLTAMLLPADIAVGVEEQSSQPESLPQMSQESYTHASYTFELRRASSRRTGVGDLWMSWEAEPLVRLRGVANSTKFGQGVITIVLDSRTKAMYASVDLKELRLSQCVKYPFPDITTNHNQLRLLTLKRRKDKFSKWSLADSERQGGKAAEIEWTNRYKLAFQQAQDDTNQITGIQLKEGDRIVKKVDFNLPLDHDKTIPEAAQSLFQPPADCKSADQLTHEMATVDLRGPHQRSSVLNDLMLLFASENPKSDWSEEFLLISSLLLPGDISVMLEDPDPPDIEKLHHIAFDYSAITASHGAHVSRSQGSIWINMEKRAFRLAGNAKKTKVGDLRIDLLVHADLDQPKIYANVQLEDEGEQQCVVYDYPTLTDDPRHDLEEAASKQLQFYSISEIDGEDCAIFVGQLPRDRSIHIWVDMESMNPNAFLRSEIHHGDKVLRSTNVERWRSGEEVLVEVQPKPEWNCREHDLSGRLANLDIRSMHKKSIQLEDTLFALHELGQDFAVREILGLTGDVAIIVKVPQPPDLSVMQQATMGFRVVADSGHGSGGEMRGNFAVDKPNGRLRIAAEAEGPSGWRITLAIDDLKALAVQLERNDGTQRRCLKVDLKGQPGMLSDGPRIGTGLFEGVETVRGGSDECNHFSFNAAGADSRSLDLWYSEESKQVCQIDLLTAGGRSGSSQLVRIEANTFIDGYMPEVEDFAGFTAQPEDWECDSSTDSPWVRLRADSAEMLVRSDIQEVSTVGRVSEALGMLGILPSQALAVLLSAEIAPPLGAPPQGSEDQETPSKQRTFEDVTLAPKSPGPSCCKTKGLQAHPEGLAWPIVERYDGEYSCVGGDILSEQQWIEKLSQRIHVPGDHAVGLCLLEGYFEREILPGATIHPQWVNDDILSPILKHFTFTFESTFPLGGYPEGKVANGQKFTGETYRKRHRGEGEVRVDLERRRLYLMSRTEEFSQGIQSLTSEIIYRGDLNQLWARTGYKGRLEYVQCWQIDTAKVFRSIGSL